MAGPTDGGTAGGLTDSEAMLLALVREGRMDAEIAVRLGLSTGEVKERIERLATKLDVSGRAGLREPALMEAAPAEAAVPAPEREARGVAARGLLVLVAIVAVAGLAFVAGRRSVDEAAGADATAVGTATVAATLPSGSVTRVATPPASSPTAALTITTLVVRGGKQFYDLGKMISMPFSISPVEAVEERGAATVVTMTGDSFLDFDVGPWSLDHSLPPGSDAFFLNGTIKPNVSIRLRIQTSSNSTRMVSGPSGTAFYSSQPGGRTQIIVSATDIQTGGVHWPVTFDSEGHLLLGTTPLFPVAVINDSTGEVMDVSRATDLPYGVIRAAPNLVLPANDCEPRAGCHLDVIQDVISPVGGTLTCVDGITRVHTANFTLVMRRSTASGIQPCPSSGSRTVAAGDLAVAVGPDAGAATVSAEAPDGSPLSIVTNLVGTIYVGPIDVKYGCPCMRGS